MVSIKRFVTFSLVMVLALLILTFVMNNRMNNDIANGFNLIGIEITELTRIHSDINLDLKVLDNIVSQRVGFQTYTAERKEKLLSAYNANYKEGILILEEIVKYTESIKIRVDDVTKLPLDEYSNKRKELVLSANRLYLKSMEFKEDIDATYNKNYFISRTDTDSIFEIYKAFRQELEALNNRYLVLNTSLILAYGYFMNVLIITLILIVCFLSYSLLRLLIVDLYSVVEGFRKLEQHDYDATEITSRKHIFKEEKEIFKLVSRVFKERRLIDDVKKIMSRSYIIDDLLEDLFKKLNDEFGVDRLGIAFIDYNDRTIIADYGISASKNIQLKPGFKVSFDETTLTNVIYSNKGYITKNVSEVLLERPESVSLKVIEEEGVKSNMILPISKDNTVFAILFLSSFEEDKYGDEDFELASKIVYDIGTVLDQSYLAKVIFSNITNTFAELVDKKDNETGGHIIRMVSYSRIIASGLINHEDADYCITGKFVSEIERNASVHDIGKVAIPDAILKKPGKLTPDEWEIMKTHALTGGEIFKNLKDSLKGFNKDFYKIAENIAVGHHEKWDGSGYPYGMSGNEIPLEARIVAMADVFDALTSKRVYKDEFSFDEAIQIILDTTGKHFDPVISKVFIEKMDEIKHVYITYKDYK